MGHQTRHDGNRAIAKRKCETSRTPRFPCSLTTMTRRELMNGLLGLAASGGRLLEVDAAGPIGQSSQASQDSQTSIPPNGIGRRIRHVSYSDQGGRPDGVQIMVNRR